MLPILVESIRRLDYPKVKLDVLILLEEDDEETVQAARAMNLPSHFRIIVVPNGNPKGKPKALNYGLLHARGEYVVIYDAEDTPDVQQLKHAVVIFNKTDESLCCIQGKLNYYNRDQNLLTQWFTIEYSMWFDLLLPGLNATDAPIPLGGTSNHFRVRQLQELGAWDPYNVTEDADLGVRLYKAGYSTAVMDSTTYEEANSQFFNWINQRSRWVKGYIQSYLVHMRHPIALWRALGPKAFLSFQLIVGRHVLRLSHQPGVLAADHALVHAASALHRGRLPDRDLLHRQSGAVSWKLQLHVHQRRRLFASSVLSSRKVCIAFSDLLGHDEYCGLERLSATLLQTVLLGEDQAWADQCRALDARRGRMSIRTKGGHGGSRQGVVWARNGLCELLVLLASVALMPWPFVATEQVGGGRGRHGGDSGSRVSGHIGHRNACTPGFLLSRPRTGIEAAGDAELLVQPFRAD